MPAGPLPADPTNARPQDPMEIFGDPWGNAEPAPAPGRPSRGNPLNLFRRPVNSRAA